MANRHNYKNLEVRKKARALVKNIYVLAAKFPKEESFGLTSQFRRTLVSISLNIAEGSGRTTDKEFSHFLDNSFGFALEVENVIFLSLDLKFISQQQHDELLIKISEIQKMLKGFQAQLNNKSNFLKSIFLSFSSWFLALDSKL